MSLLPRGMTLTVVRVSCLVGHLKITGVTPANTAKPQENRDKTWELQVKSGCARGTFDPQGLVNWFNYGV